MSKTCKHIINIISGKRAAKKGLHIQNIEYKLNLDLMKKTRLDDCHNIEDKLNLELMKKTRWNDCHVIEDKSNLKL